MTADTQLPLSSSRSSQSTLRNNGLETMTHGEHEKSTHGGDGISQTSSPTITNDAGAEQRAQKPAGGPPPPPNGGLQAWLHVLGGFMLFLNTWGVLNTFGVYQTYYESGELFRESSSNISWIGAIQAFMVLFVGFLSGPIYDRGYFRELILAGTFGVVFGHFMLSLCHTYWQVLLSQGFLVGIGAGCLFVPCVAILPSYWSTKLGLAVGLAAAGSSIGGIIYPVAFYKLIGQLGFAWTTRIIGFIALATLLIPIGIMKMRFKPPKPRALIDWSAFTDVQFMTCVFAVFLGFIGLYVIFFYISYYAAEQHITDTAMSFYIICVLNGASTLGRTLPNALSDKTGPVNLITPGAFIVGILIFSMMAVKSEAALIVVAILFGFFSGVFIALPPVLFVSLTKDKSKIGTRIGMGFGMIAFCVLIAGPGGGGILGNKEGDLHWPSIWIYGGVTAIASGVVFLILRVWRAGFKPMVKV